MRLRSVSRPSKDQARRELIAASRAFERAKAVLDRRRAELHARIVVAAQAEITKSQIARDTGYTREYVTKLVDDAKDRAAREADDPVEV